MPQNKDRKKMRRSRKDVVLCGTAATKKCIKIHFDATLLFCGRAAKIGFHAEKIILISDYSGILQKFHYEQFSITIGDFLRKMNDKDEVKKTHSVVIEPCTMYW